MKRFTFAAFLLAVILVWTACSGPQKSIEEEKALTALSEIQSKLETSISYEDFIALLDRAKIEIDLLKRNGKNNPCFMGAVERCYAYYLTGGKAWKKKMEATDEALKNDMDLTLSVLQSQAALSIQMANNCYLK
jgi:hypothetical protein